MAKFREAGKKRENIRAGVSKCSLERSCPSASHVQAGLIGISYFHGALRSFWQRNFDLCRHVEIISARLFSMVRGLAVAIAAFSLKQMSHRREPHLQGAAFWTIFHLMVYSRLLAFRSHTYFESSVAFLYSSARNECTWALYRVLNVPSVNPKYTRSGFVFAVTVARYTTLSVRQLPLSGHAVLFLQLHLRLLGSQAVLRT